ncbi:uncharacterized protein Z519_05201 [Cladophialophora bantiana CBS 173.52]|uniref:Uncharacterized protein n=1 Tax=Cladophialophora bantiana (strain ATCC 10958 / CBS 173.52 / CDC B-1940 / NIH 8579) TaxID=1442370 RepID=A0A0D2EVN1_CLAB1|nr:uncharacterized protein Z519_05201 [Cladophialophora bantiana CBS 173.52]KIW93886.1 hypothetical protein Z519_05201 [Cladophialophora bantiana CBS 173.52]
MSSLTDSLRAEPFTMSTTTASENIALVCRKVTEVQQNSAFDLIDDFIHQDWVLKCLAALEIAKAYTSSCATFTKLS